MEDQKQVDVRYLNREFDSIQDQLINFAEAYYPDTVQDFSEGSVGLMYIDMASYVGDVLSFYTDVQFKEGFIQFAEERQNVVALANQLGYRPNVTNPATTELDVFAVVPSRIVDGQVQPDFRFVPIIEQNMVVSSASNPNVQFRTLEDVNFEVDTPESPLEIQIFEQDPNTGNPASFLLSKRVRAAAGRIETTTFSFNDPEPFPSVVIDDEDVIDILSVTDSEGNEWREVPYLAQEQVFEDFRNTESASPELSEFRDETPFLLRSNRQPKRFISRTRSDGKTTLQFGSGVNQDNQERVVPNPLTIGNPQIESIDQLNLSLDPANFLSIDSFGQVPFDTTLEVEYVVGGGTESNVPINDLTSIVDLNFNLENVDVVGDENRQTLQDIQNSVRVTNPVPGTGGGPQESTQEVRKNAQAFFAAQNRVVTEEDYITRVLSMPSRFGSVAKATVDQNIEQDNPLAVDLRVLGFNKDGHLVPVNEAIKQNIQQFLRRYRMLTDSVNILDGFVVNLQAEVEISVFRTFSDREAKVNVIQKLEEMFSPNNRDFNQPIVKGQIVNELNSLEGVQNVGSISFENVFSTDEGYSGNQYNLDRATRQGVIFPSQDPSVFTIRFPNKDIKVRNV
jgi:hypothetical protein